MGIGAGWGWIWARWVVLRCMLATPALLLQHELHPRSTWAPVPRELMETHGLHPCLHYLFVVGPAALPVEKNISTFVRSCGWDSPVVLWLIGSFSLPPSLLVCRAFIPALLGLSVWFGEGNGMLGTGQGFSYQPDPPGSLRRRWAPGILDSLCGREFRLCWSWRRLCSAPGTALAPGNCLGINGACGCQEPQTLIPAWQDTTNRNFTSSCLDFCAVQARSSRVGR